MDSNDISATFSTNRIIAFLVAFIMVAVVAIPIVNALTDEQDGGGDGGLITYMNTGDYYYKPTANDNTVHTFIIEDTSIATSEYAGTYTTTLKEDGVILDTYNGWWDEYENSVPSIPFVFGWNNNDKFLYSSDSSIIGLSGDALLDGIKEDETIISETEYKYEMTFTVQNGVVSYINYEDEQVTSDITLDYLISADGTGEYVHAQTPFKTDTNTTIFVCEGVLIEDAEHDMFWGTYITGDINSNDLTSPSVSIDLTAIGIGTQINSIDSTVTSTNDKGLITVSKIESDISMAIPDREGTYYVSDTVSLGAIVPTIVTIDPSAPVEVTVTNSGQTYKELDEGEYTFSTVRTGSEQIVSVNDEEIARVPYDEYGDYPVLCTAFGKTASMWLMANGSYLAVSNGHVVGEYGTPIYNHIWSPRPGAEYVMDYIISNSGDYVYCTDSAKCLNTDNLYISALDETEYYTYVGYIYYGAPKNIDGGIVIDSNWTIDQMNVDSLNNGQYTEIRNIEIIASENGSDSTLDTTINGFFVPKTFTYTESPDSDDTGSNPTNTIIKAIPIFLVLGLLVAFVMPMVQTKIQ